MAKILRDAGLSGLVEDQDVECLARGFQFTEGPLWCPDGSLLFQDIKAERTYRLDPDRSVHLLRERTGAANGQTFGPDGRIVFCEQNGRRVSRMIGDGTGVETLVETWAGKRLNSPNDIVCRSDGIALFHRSRRTASSRPSARSISRASSRSTCGRRPGAAGLEPQLLLDDFEKPNGLAFSPDERTLYVCDTARYHIRAFDVEPSGSLRVGSGRVFARLDPAKPGGPDGMKVDRDGPGLRRGRRRASGSSSPTAGCWESSPCPPGRRTSPGATRTPAAWRSRPSTPSITSGCGSRGGCPHSSD